MHARSFLPLAGLLAVACAPAFPARPDVAPVSYCLAAVSTPATAVNAPVIPKLDLSKVNADMGRIGQQR